MNKITLKDVVVNNYNALLLQWDVKNIYNSK